MLETLGFYKYSYRSNIEEYDSMEKYGFVYLWFDKKRKMYYVGCHWGTVNDEYICSSNRMRDAYRRRPKDFKRRILKMNIERSELLKEEYQWLQLIKKEELGKKYYNTQNHHFGHWITNEKHVVKPLSEEARKKISLAKKGKPHTEETKQKIRAKRALQIITEETKQKIRESHLGEKNHFYGKKHSNETRKHMSKVALGRTVSEETRKKLSDIHKSIPRHSNSLNNLAMYREKLKTEGPSMETRIKMKEAARLRWDRKET